MSTHKTLRLSLLLGLALTPCVASSFLKTKAASARVNLIEFDFGELVEDPCGVATQIGDAMRRTDWQSGDIALHTCESKVTHTKDSHRELDMKGRLGAAAATSVRAQLEGTSYGWMLDLSLVSPPPGQKWSTPYEDAGHHRREGNFSSSG